MHKLKGLNPLNLFIGIRQKYITNTYRMRISRYINGIELNSEEFLKIGKEFKNEIKNNNMTRALEVLGKYNDKTLNRIFEFNNQFSSMQFNFNFFLGKNSDVENEKKSTINEAKETNKSENSSTNSNEEIKTESQNNDKNKELFNQENNYKKLFTPEEIEMIKDIASDKDKIIEFIRLNALTIDSIILRNNYSTSVNVKGIRREGKFIYILIVILIFTLSYDSKGTLKCIILLV